MTITTHGARAAARKRPLSPRRGRWRSGLGRLALSAVAGITYAAGVVAEIQQIQSDPAAYTEAMEAGRRVATFCFNCHGEAGHSQNPETPNIAGQNAAYLLAQMRKFAAGERRNEFMQGLTRAMSDEERRNVALYFAAQAPLPASGKPGPSAAAGEALFRKTCAACHGELGHGKEGIPRIAGQQGAYLTRALSAYRNRDGTRGDPQMSTIAAGLSDREISALSVYLSALP